LVLSFVLLFACFTLSYSQTCTPRSASRSGVCQNVNTDSCSGQYYRGACPGASNIQCCVPAAGNGVGSSDNGNDDVGGGPVALSPGRGSGGGWGSYTAPSGARSALGNFFSSVSANSVSWGYRGARATFMLPGGAFYYESKLDTDCDGAPSCPSIDSSGQTRTSWSWRGSPIDALKTNYFVLPGNIRSRLGTTRLGLGDIAAVVYNGRLEFAVYADSGPTSKIGEGSVRLAQSLGFNPYGRNGRICCGITSGVVTIVFPGSRGSYSSPYDRDSVRQAGMARLNALMNGGSAAIDGSNNSFDGVSQAAPLSSVIIILSVAAGILCAIAIVIVVVIVVRLNKSRQQAEQRP